MQATYRYILFVWIWGSRSHASQPDLESHLNSFVENGRQTQAVGHGVLCERCGSPLQDRSPRCCDRMGAGPHPHVDPVRRWRGKAKAQGGFQQRRVVEDWKGQTYIRNRRDQTGGSEYGSTVVARQVWVQTRVVVRRSGEDAHGYECLCWDSIEHHSGWVVQKTLQKSMHLLVSLVSLGLMLFK